MPSSKPLQPLVLDSLGVSGLNTQANATSLDHSWLTMADNIMLDAQGRITSRKGFKQISEGLEDKTIKSIGERLSQTGVSEVIAGIDTALYKVDTSTVPYGLTALSFTGTAPTVTDSNWQFTNFNGHLYGTQRGHTLIAREDHAPTPTLIDVTTHTSYQANSDITTMNPSCSLGAFGKLWVGNFTENKNLVARSDNLQGHKWNSGVAGVIDMQTVWGNDEVVALSAVLGKLVIFGKRNIAIYSNPWDAGTGADSSFQLDDLIKGIGCVARDSVQAYGDDIIFLSETGVRSLARTTEKDNLPLTSLTRSITNELNAIMPTTVTGADSIKSAYDAIEGFYVLTFGSKKTTYVLDFKNVTPEGSPLITKWNIGGVKEATSYLYTLKGELWIGHANRAALSKYEGYTDTFLAYTYAVAEDADEKVDVNDPSGVGGWTTVNSLKASWDGTQVEGTTTRLLDFVSLGVLTIGTNYRAEVTVTDWVVHDYTPPEDGTALSGSGFSSSITQNTSFTVDFEATLSGGGTVYAVGHRGVSYTVEISIKEITAYPTTNNISYLTRLKTVWLDWGNSGVSKILKSLRAVITGGAGSVMSFKWLRDYSTIGTSVNIPLKETTSGAEEYGLGTAEYNISEYLPAPLTQEYKTSLSNSAKVLQVEITNVVEGNKTSLDNLTILAKQGKVR